MSLAMKAHKSVLFLLVLLLLIGSASAIGITPGRTTVAYEPGATHTVDFTVVNSESEPITVVLYVEGAFNQSITLSDVTFALQPGESRVASYTVTLPAGADPGRHTANIIALQIAGVAGSSESFFGSAVGVATQFVVNVPYPGKYAEGSFNVVGPEEDGTLTFVLPVLSQGDLDLVRVRGVIDIYGPFNDEIATIQTNEIPIASKERGELVAKWSADVAPGQYRAVATIIYDEQTLTLEKVFSVGSRLLELDGIEVNDFSLGGIAKFEMLVENKWSEPIIGAYAQMEVYNDAGAVMADFKSATYDLPPLEKEIMVAFWDTEGVREGSYDSRVYLRYGEQSAQQDLELQVRDDDITVVGVGYVISESESGSGNSMVVVLITVIVVLIMVNLLWFLYLRKKIAALSPKNSTITK